MTTTLDPTSLNADLFASWTQDQLDALLDLSVEDYQALVARMRAEKAAS